MELRKYNKTQKRKNYKYKIEGTTPFVTCIKTIHSIHSFFFLVFERYAIKEGPFPVVALPKRMG